MIILTISWLIFIYILFSVIVLLIIWITAGYRDRKRVRGGSLENIWKCSVCLSDYVDSKFEDISVCPLCGSYNKRQEEKGVY